jgi:hypothetical protein
LIELEKPQNAKSEEISRFENAYRESTTDMTTFRGAARWRGIKLLIGRTANQRNNQRRSRKKPHVQ